MYITRFIISLIKNIKYQRVLNDAYEKDQLIAKLSHALGVQFHRDWIGRIYAVINPNIKDGKFSPEQVYEFNAMGGADNTEFMQQWIMGRLNIIRNFIMAENLFDLLTFNIERIDDKYNYLFVIQPITLQRVLDNSKIASLEIGALLGLLIGYLWIF